MSTTKLETLSLEDCKISALNLKPLTKINLKKLYVINCTLKSIDKYIAGVVVRRATANVLIIRKRMYADKGEI